MNTRNVQIQTPQIETTTEFIIGIKMDHVKIMVETTPYMGRLYTYISVRDENCRPKMRVITPPWVWRRLRRMIQNGEDVRRISDFILHVFKEFVVVNITDRPKPNYYRIYYEEPYRLLSEF